MKIRTLDIADRSVVTDGEGGSERAGGEGEGNNGEVHFVYGQKVVAKSKRNGKKNVEFCEREKGEKNRKKWRGRVKGNEEMWRAAAAFYKALRPSLMRNVFLQHCHSCILIDIATLKQATNLGIFHSKLGRYKTICLNSGSMLLFFQAEVREEKRNTTGRGTAAGTSRRCPGCCKVVRSLGQMHQNR